MAINQSELTQDNTLDIVSREHTQLHILEQLKILNHYMSILTDEHIILDDIEDNGNDL